MEIFNKNVCQFPHCRLVYKTQADLLHHIQRVHVDYGIMPGRVRYKERLFVNPLRMSPFLKQLPKQPPKPIGVEPIRIVSKGTSHLMENLDSSLRSEIPVDELILSMVQRPLEVTIERHRIILMARIRRQLQYYNDVHCNGRMSDMYNLLNVLHAQERNGESANELNASASSSRQMSARVVKENVLFKKCQLDKNACQQAPSVRVTQRNDAPTTTRRCVLSVPNESTNDATEPTWFGQSNKSTNLNIVRPMLPRIRGPMLTAPKSNLPVEMHQFVKATTGHLTKKSAEVSFLCQEPGCSKRYKGERRLRQHIKDAHNRSDVPKPKIVNHRCPCGKTYKTKAGLANHERIGCHYPVFSQKIMSPHGSALLM